MSTNSIAPNLDAIKPTGPGKYSPNLYQWLKAQPRNDLIRVFKDQDGTLWIGYFDDDNADGGWFTVVRLMSVLCMGRKATTGAYAARSDFKLHEIEDFWARYQEDGRCAIDPEHVRGFTGDETRWKEHGDTRECLWCGRRTEKLETWTETVLRKAWRPIDQTQKAEA